MFDQVEGKEHAAGGVDLPSAHLLAHDLADPWLTVGAPFEQQRAAPLRPDLPVDELALKTRILGTVEAALADNVLAWDLGPDGAYVRRYPKEGESERSLQQVMMAQALERAAS